MIKLRWLLLAFLGFHAISIAMDKTNALEKVLSKYIDCNLYGNQILALPIEEYTKSSKSVIIVPLKMIHKPSGLAIICSKLITHQINKNHFNISTHYCLSDGSYILANQDDIEKIASSTYSLAIQITEPMKKDFLNVQVYTAQEFVEYLQTL